MLNRFAFNNNLKKFFADSENGERVFLLGLFFYLVNTALGWTTFSWGGLPDKILEFVATVCFVVKILWFGRYSKKELLGATFLFVIVLIIQGTTGNKRLLTWVVILLAAKDVDFENVLKVYLTSVGSVLVSAVVASQLGAIVNLVYRRAELERNSFGITYPTDFAAMVFFLMLAYLYVERKSLNWWKLTACLLVDVVVYNYCNTRLDCSTMLMAIVGFSCLSWKRPRCDIRNILKGRSILSRYGLYVMPICAVFIFALSLFYIPEADVLSDMNDLLSTRLAIGHKALIEYPWNPFGTYIKMMGNGGTTIMPMSYTFLDCSYINVFLRYGYIFLAIIIGIHMACCNKYKDDDYFILAISLIAINCMVAHHMMEYVCNIFPLALLAKRSVKSFAAR